MYTIYRIRYQTRPTVNDPWGPPDAKNVLGDEDANTAIFTLMQHLGAVQFRLLEVISLAVTDI